MKLRISGGTLRNRWIKTPPATITRPTSEKLRQAIFNRLQHTIEHAYFLDLFAGSGAIGIEALSRGADQAVFVDNHMSAYRILTDNLKQLQLTSYATVLKMDAFQSIPFLTRKKEQFSHIYLDPPYHIKRREELMQMLAQSKIIRKGGIVILETGTPLKHPQEYKNLHLEKEKQEGQSYLYFWIYTS